MLLETFELLREPVARFSTEAIACWEKLGRAGYHVATTIVVYVHACIVLEDNLKDTTEQQTRQIYDRERQFSTILSLGIKKHDSATDSIGQNGA